MTYNEWERELLNQLDSLNEKDRQEALDYYREMYGDKREAGLADEQIIKEFGDPIVCAAKIIVENGSDTAKKQDGDNSKINLIKEKAQKISKNFSFSKIIGWFFLGILVIIPIASVVISAIASLAAVAISGAIAAVGGVLAALASPFTLIIGYTFTGVLATAGAGLCVAGIGAVLAIAFYFITKYSVFASWKITKYCFKGRENK